MKKDIDILEENYTNNILSESRIDIIDEILLQYIKKSNVHPQKERKLSFFLGGGSNAGKSTFRNDLKSAIDNLLIIDADELKKEIPEYTGLNIQNPKIAASIVHEESSQMASQLLIKAIEKEISTIFDGTLKNTDKYMNFVQLLKQANFAVNLIIIDVPVTIALERNRIRYEEALHKGEFARLVPDKVVIESHEMIAKSFHFLKKVVDSWVIIDTQDDKNETIAQGSNGEEEILNFTKYLEFLNK